MIDQHFDELVAVTSTKEARVLLGAPRATRYRRRRPPVAGPPTPRPAPPNALIEAERQHVDDGIDDREAAAILDRLYNDEPPRLEDER